MAARLVPVNWIDTDHCSDLAVTSSASSSLGIGNVQSAVRGDVWRSSSLSAQVITGTFGGNARQISHLSIWPADGSSLIGAQVRVRMWSDVAQTTLVRDVAATDFWTPSGDNYNTFLWGIQSWNVSNSDKTARLAPFVTWFTPIAVSAFEITITNAGAVDTNYFEIRRIVLGDYVEAPYNAGLGAAPKWGTTSKFTRGKFGGLRRQTGALSRELRAEYAFKAEADRAAWMDFCYMADPGNEILLSLFQDGTKRDRDFTVLGSLEVLNPMVWENVDFHKLQLAIVES